MDNPERQTEFQPLPSPAPLLEKAQGLGAQRLLAAGKRCLLASAEVGGVAMLIDAKGARAAAWYASYGALPLLDAPLSLVLPLTTIEAALKVKI